MSAAPLAGRAALVTGASSGIGAAVAEHLAASGADVALCARRADLLEQTAERVRAQGRRALVLPQDLADTDAAAELPDRVAGEWGRLDVLVNNAGVLSGYSVADMGPGDWDAVLAVNLRTAVFLAKAAVPAMQQQAGGSIVSIGSSLAGAGGAGMEGVDYNVSKVGLQVWTKTFAREVGPTGVRVNCVACGAVDTPMHALWRDALIEEWVPRIPLRRIGTPQDVAQAVGFLASDAAAYITGQTLHVNGGLQGAYG
jgi:3-oxoacyl-[acyl-carrier protein] reductase